MAIRERKPQVSPLRLKITLFIAGVGPLLAVGLWLQIQRILQLGTPALPIRNILVSGTCRLYFIG